MFDLSGQTALVTGASGGIGGAIARALHRQGAALMLAGTRAEALQALAAELGERAHVGLADLADPLAADRLLKETEAALGHLDILVNNAGLARDALALRMTDQDWQAVLDIDLTAAFRLTRAALRGMVRRRRGRIIAVTSIVAVDRQPRPGELCRGQGGADRHVEIDRRRGREPRHHRQLRRPGPDRDGDDRQAERRTAHPAGCRDPGGTVRAAGATSPPPSSIWRAPRPPMSPAIPCT